MLFRSNGSSWVPNVYVTLKSLKYNHLVAIRTSSNDLFTFLNSTLVGYSLVTGNLNSNSLLNFQIGIGYSLASSRYFNGKISNFNIYNRALTASEVLQNYNATRNRYGV